MADFSSLKNQILDDIKQNKTVATSQQKINAQLKNGTANYKSAADFSKALGSAVGDSFKKNVTDVADEELGTFAKEVVAPVYSQEQKTMLSVCSKVQKQVNKDAGLEINPVEVKQDTSRIQHIVQRFEEASSFDEVSFLLGENVAQSIARGAVNDSMEDNIDFQEDTGLKTLIVRTDGGGCCDWCASVCGEFHSREELPEDFWRVHRNCNCVIDYRVGKTKDKISFNTDENKKLVKVTEEIQEGSNIVANLEQKGIQVNIEKAEKLKDIAILNLEHLDELTNEYNTTLVSYSVGALSGTQTELGSAYMLNGKTSVTISPEAFKIKKATDSLGLGNKQVLGTTYHEFAHSLSQSREKTDKDFWKEIRELKKEYESMRNTPNWFDIRISPYASKDIDEFIAESFTQAKLSEKPSPYALRVLEVINKYFKK